MKMDHMLRCSGLLVLVLVVSGCGKTDPNDAVAAVNDTNMKKLANLYFTYQMKNNWEGPSTEEEFRQFIQSFNAGKLARIGIDPSAVDGLFVNDRDGKPFKIRYGVRGSAMGSTAPVVFEEEGVNGKFLVGFLNMEQREVERYEYEQLWSENGANTTEGQRSS